VCFERYKKKMLRGKTVCEQKRNCVACGSLLTNKSHECNKPYCANCKKNMVIGHLCYMATLKNELPRSDNVLFDFYDYETTQDTEVSDWATLHVPNLVCLQRFCIQCEISADIDDAFSVVVRENIHSGMILSEICFHISANLDHGSSRLWL
jgi:hypothetical protein